MQTERAIIHDLEQYNSNKQVKSLLKKVNPLLASKADNIRIHLEALIDREITKEQFNIIESKLTLGRLCLNLEELIENSNVTMLFYSEKDNKIHHGAAPNMEIEFFDFFHDINQSNAFTDKCGSCGYAVHKKEMIITDIETDPLWGPLRSHFMSKGYKTGWSIPIIKDDKVIGTFAIYRKCKTKVTEEEIEIVTSAISDYLDVIISVAKQYH